MAAIHDLKTCCVWCTIERGTRVDAHDRHDCQTLQAYGIKCAFCLGEAGCSAGQCPAKLDKGHDGMFCARCKMPLILRGRSFHDEFANACEEMSEDIFAELLFALQCMTPVPMEHVRQELVEHFEKWRNLLPKQKKAKREPEEKLLCEFLRGERNALGPDEIPWLVNACIALHSCFFTSTITDGNFKPVPTICRHHAALLPSSSVTGMPSRGTNAAPAAADVNRTSGTKVATRTGQTTSSRPLSSSSTAEIASTTSSASREALSNDAGASYNVDRTNRLQSLIPASGTSSSATTQSSGIE